MDNKLKIGIRNTNPERINKVNEIFKSVSDIIRNKKGFLCNFQIEDYEILKRKFSEEDIDFFEKSNPKALCNFEEAILINESFFECIEINQKSVALHEIFHILNKPPQEVLNDFDNPLVKYVYGEYLADYHLFNIDKDIFLNGRIIPDLDTISIKEIKKDIALSNNEDDFIKGKFQDIGRLYYYYIIYPYQPIISKIDELIGLIREYFSDIDFILKNLQEVCNQLKLKKYQELKDLFYKIDMDILNLTRSQPDQPRLPINP